MEAQTATLLAIPCATCRTEGGYTPADQLRPIRRSGSRYGISGKLCRACYDRQRTLAGLASRSAEDGAPDVAGRLELVREAKRLREELGLNPVLDDADLDVLLSPGGTAERVAAMGRRAQRDWPRPERDAARVVYRAPRFGRKAIG